MVLYLAFLFTHVDTVFPRVVPAATINFRAQKGVDTIRIYKKKMHTGLEPRTSWLVGANYAT